MRKLFNKHAGVTLVELMIAMALGIVVLLGVTGVFVSGQQSYNDAQRYGQLQGDLSLLSDYLTGDIRSASTVVTAANGSNTTLTLGSLVYTLTGNSLSRNNGVQDDILSDQVDGFNVVCIAADATETCVDPVVVRVAISLRSAAGSDVRSHLIEFNVAIRNNVLAKKFS